MARIDLTTLKSKFETGDRPTGADYADLIDTLIQQATDLGTCLLYTSPSPRDLSTSRMPSSA